MKTCSAVAVALILSGCVSTVSEPQAQRALANCAALMNKADWGDFYTPTGNQTNVCHVGQGQFISLAPLDRPDTEIQAKPWVLCQQRGQKPVGLTITPQPQHKELRYSCGA